MRGTHQIICGVKALAKFDLVFPSTGIIAIIGPNGELKPNESTRRNTCFSERPRRKNNLAATRS